MEIFTQLKEFYGTHKNAAKELNISYNTYNQWRYFPQTMSPHIKTFLELAAEKASHEMSKRDVGRE